MQRIVGDRFDQAGLLAADDRAGDFLAATEFSQHPLAIGRAVAIRPVGDMP
ncbi:MAG: hypothetical protein JF591_01585 [Lysobacter sp.]|nr:hypothetical protein [Lysobacter sp.]